MKNFKKSKSAHNILGETFLSKKTSRNSNKLTKNASQDKSMMKNKKLIKNMILKNQDMPKLRAKTPKQRTIKETIQLIKRMEREKEQKQIEDLQNQIEDLQNQIEEIKKKTNFIIETKLMNIKSDELEKLKYSLKNLVNYKKDKFIHCPIQIFQSKMNFDKFMEFVTFYVNERKQDWPKIDRESFIKQIVNNRILSFIISDIDPLLSFKFDIIIGILGNPYKYDSTLVPCLQINDYTNLKDQKIKFSYQAQQFKLSKKIICLFATTDTLLTVYRKALLWQDISVSKNKIKERLITFINDTNFYFVDLPLDVYGCTIFDGSIFINRALLNGVQQKNNTEMKIQNLALIFSTIYHEIGHCVLRMFRENEKNFYINIEPKEIEQSFSSKVNDFGDFCDYQLLGIVNCFYLSDSLYLLQIKNYYKYRDFRARYEEIKTKCIISEKNKAIKLRTMKNGVRFGLCLFSHYRNTN